MLHTNNIKYIIVSLICVILGVQSIYSQKADSLRSLYLSKSLAKDINLSLYSPTFSSSSFDKQIAYSDVGITFRNEIGNFHRVQLAENYNSVGFMADGSYIGKRLYMVGTFDFQQEFKNKVSFTSLLNPFRGTPYDLADSTSSNWRVQNYCVNGKIAYELVPGALSLGLDGSINVARGAKQIDPRPKTNNNDIVFTPSLSFHRNGHIISIGGSYKMFKENVNLILYNSSESQKIYQLKGLGQYTYSIFSTTERDRKYIGNGMSGVVSYQYSNASLSFLLQGKYTNYGEKAADIEESKLKTIGKFFNDDIDINAEIKYQYKHSVNTLNLKYKQINQSGREIIQIFNPSEDVNDWETESEIPRRWTKNISLLGGEYNYYLLSKDNKYSQLNIELQAWYSTNNEEYKVMDTYRKYNSLFLQLSPKYSFFIAKNFFSSINIVGGYNFINDFEAQYIEREEDDHTIKNRYFDYDSNIISSNYFKLGGAINCGYSLKNGSSFVLDINYFILKATERNRHNIGASLIYNW